MQSILDCQSVESTICSLAALIGLEGQTIREVIASFDCSTYSAIHPYDHRHLREILPQVLCKRGAQVQTPDIACWFHGTRVLNPDTIRTLGVLSLHQRIEQIWEDLFSLAQHWVNRDEWQRFRATVETTDPLGSSGRHRHRMGCLTDGGPHAVLICDAIAAPSRFGGVDYLSAPETIEDLCESFRSHFHQDLLSKFQKESIPCIVKFHDRCRRDDLVGVALSYLWCSIHEEPCATCNTCLEGNRDTIPVTAIVEIQELHKDSITMHGKVKWTRK